MADGAPFYAYSVFRRENGRRAVVLANMSDKKTATCEVTLESASPATPAYVTPEQPDPKPWPGKLETAPASAVVYMEG